MRYGLIVLVFLSLTATAQPLRDINYNFQYDPNEPFTLTIKTVRTTSGLTAYYTLTLRDTTQRADQFVLQWDLRSSLEDKQGVSVEPGSVQRTAAGNKIEGSVTVAGSSTRQMLTAKVLNNLVKRAWVFYKMLEPNYPVNGYLSSNGKLVEEPYIKINTAVSVNAEGETKVASYYNDDFPAAVPAFSEGMGRVSRAMKVDSTFTVSTNQALTFSKKGLYLIQKDTASTEGFAFRSEEDYPRLGKIESLADPLIYICTKQEFEKVKAAKGDKKAFDRVILSITGNAERARNFMRNYFRRVEWSNIYFTSYKEGWKTDRGMIYILFGLPDEVFRFNDREVWTYKSNDVKATFHFVKSSTLFDPDNFVLVRERKFQETWYEKVDLWRNARF